jgi:hypothetical protein
MGKWFTTIPTCNTLVGYVKHVSNEQLFLSFTLDTDVEGDWVHVGCSVINNECINFSTTYDTTADMKTVYLCSGCDVQCTNVEQTKCNCYCPIYEQDPTGEPFEPYCR